MSRIFLCTRKYNFRHIHLRTISLSATSQMRLPYAPKTPEASASKETQEIYARVEARRAPRPLQPLDLTLLHSPSIADGWNSFLGAVRTKSSLPADVREIAICRVAALNGAVYEWEHHLPLAVEAGVGSKGVAAMAEGGRVVPATSASSSHEGLSEKQEAVLRYTDAMTKHVNVPELEFTNIKKHFSEQEIVEITATIAAYNCVSRFLVALDIGERNKAAKF